MNTEPVSVPRNGHASTAALRTDSPADRRTCILAGEESLALQCAEILQNADFRIELIVSRAPMIRDWAAERHIPVVDRLNQLPAALNGRSVDYFFSVTNLQVLPQEILALASRAAINFHDGPLPRYAGLYATTWALINHERSYGVTWHEMAARIDEGVILKQALFELEPNETALSLNTKCYEHGIESFSSLVDELRSDRIVRTRQSGEGRTYFGLERRPPAACLLDFSRPAEDLAALVRALDFGAYPNPVGLAKLDLGSELIVVRALENFSGAAVDAGADLAGAAPDAFPGTLIEVGADGWTVAAHDGSVVIRDLRTLANEPVCPLELARRHGLAAGSRLPVPTPADAQRISDLNRETCRHESFWYERLLSAEPLELPWVKETSDTSDSGPRSVDFPLPDAVKDIAVEKDASPEAVAATALFSLLGSIGGKDDFTVSFSSAALRIRLCAIERYFASEVPLHVSLQPESSFEANLRNVAAEIDRVSACGTYLHDLRLRRPELRDKPAELPGGFVLDFAPISDPLAPAASPLILRIDPASFACRWFFDPTRVDEAVIGRLRDNFLHHLASLVAAPSLPLSAAPLATEAEQRRTLEDWNRTERNYPRELRLHDLFEARVRSAPDAPALAFHNDEISYAELDRRANRLARQLLAMGVSPEERVGIGLERSLDLAVAVVAVLKAGAAYVPLDPDFPADRLQMMARDSGARVIVANSAQRELFASAGIPMLLLDERADAIAAQPADAISVPAASSSLAYVIYTSGSTGRPKGVMVEHRNVVNFFAAMDDVLGPDEAGVWLAVTSLSFDISVLELLWTLTRGFKTVIYGREEISGKSAEPHRSSSLSTAPRSTRSIDFGLFYFASDEGAEGGEKYRLLLEGAKFADANGFTSVWTPERHFHAFGGLYPNPAVTGAAVAAITRNVRICAGSCVIPLHHPIRVAEEWSLVDNISNGRVGIACAAGWQPNDFVLRPESFANHKQLMVDNIETIRRLWRGESVEFPGPRGDVSVRTLPRPIQPELPIWLTIAGNPETFRIAGEIGASVLTHLLGQSVEELAEKLAVYRNAWRKAGHPGNGYVTLMLHTFVGEDDDEVREIVREPMKNYLRSAMNLVKQAAWHFPTFAGRIEDDSFDMDQAFDSMSPDESEALLDFSFERYYKTHGLFGTVETCMRMVETLKSLEIDEIGCLIDYGVPTEQALEGLKKLNELRLKSAPPAERAAEAAPFQPSAAAAADSADFSIPALIRRHGVTHMQCTPSMARMLLDQSGAREAFASLDHLLIGGEAFPTDLARDLGACVKGRILNMYGPTETTIWSSCSLVDPAADTITLGRPLANNRLYVLDRFGRPLPEGAIGELYIGGEGVVRGYHDRPDLTSERFVADPFSDADGARMYRTGDLVSYCSDSELLFHGRVDHQVKIRGYRIELGEIESALNSHPDVRESVVIAREDVPGDLRLVAYFASQGAAPPDAESLRDHLRQTLPPYMIPSHFMHLASLPQTPNRKIDRKALPKPEASTRARSSALVPAGNDLEKKIAAVWQEILNLPQVGVQDNFFDLGGHSLLAVKVHSRIRQELNSTLSLTDIFRFPTIRALAEFLEGGGPQDEHVQAAQSRADSRRKSMTRRRTMRSHARKA